MILSNQLIRQRNLMGLGHIREQKPFAADSVGD